MNKIQIWKALARGVLLESVRRKDLWVVAILGFLIMASASLLGFFGMRGLEAFAKDLASTVLGAFSTIIAVVTTGRLMPDEIKNRTLYPLLSRPITRLDLLFGKLLGAVAVSWVAFLLLATLTAVSLKLFGIPFEPIMAQYVLCKMLGLVVVCSVTLMFSCIMTPAAATTLSLVLLFGSGMIVQALVMASATADGMTRFGYQIINAVLPQVGLFDLGSRAANTNWGMVPAWVLGGLTIYMVLYSGAMLMLSWAKFNRQAV